MNSLALRAVHARRPLSRSLLKALPIAAALIAGTAAIPAHAEGFSIGLGAGADRGKTDCVATYACDHGDTYGLATAGYRFGNGLVLQATAFDAGRFQGGDVTPLGTQFGGSFKVRGVGFTAGYRWTFAPQWSLFGQAGVASVRTRFDYATPFNGSVSESSTQPLAGASLGYDIAPNWRLSVDYTQTRFKVYTTHGSLRMLGASAQYVF